MSTRIDLILASIRFEYVAGLAHATNPYSARDIRDLALAVRELREAENELRGIEPGSRFESPALDRLVAARRAVLAFDEPEEERS